MPKKNNLPNKFDELRKKAEAKLKDLSKSLPSDIYPTKVNELLHELQTYQIELELQNVDLRLAQIELQKYHQRFTDLYDFAPVGYLTVSDKGLILEANLTAAKILGVERNVLLQQPLSSYVLPENQDIFYLSRKSLLKSRNEQSCELQMKTQNGHLFSAQLKSIISQEIDGETGQYRVVLIDITARKKVEQAVIKGKRDWQETFDATKDFITIQDKECRIIRANKAAHDLFGVEFGELNGRLCYKLFKGVPTPCKECLISHPPGSKDNYSEEFTNVKLGKTIQFSTSFIRNEINEIEKIIHVGRDITERKLIEEELLQAKKMEATFALAGGIAHNFNNLLTIMMGNQELALESMALPEKEQERIAVAHMAAKRAAKLSGMMLQFVGQEKTAMRHIDTNIVIKEICQVIRPQIKSQISLIHNDSDKIFLKCDISMIRDMITSLIINAVEAIGDAAGEITLETRQRYYSEEELRNAWQKEILPAKEYVSISVIDNGPGMGKEIMDRAFDPFFTEKFTGRGLGLATVLGIVRSHKGTISLSSKLGVGTKVKVLLPAMTTVNLPEEKPPIANDEFSRTGGTVLVVDDEPILLKLVSTYLDNLGLQVLTAENGLDALEIFAENKHEIVVILLDIVMPKLNGFDTLTKIREESEVPVLVMTGHALDRISADFKNFSNCNLLQKPFSLEELNSKLQIIIK